ncbi:hypothetical protein GCM10010191_78770 [Actinomadura vinacea]|uniref:Uncharacterized protein n=1 Tax=Actinomadura vinacea TaxID=115336 RepID=A0ABN3K851_9ACTN
MTLKIARIALFTLLPAELLLVVLLVSGVPVPAPLIAVAEAVVAAVLVLEAAVAYRLFRAARRGGSDRRAALREVRDRLVPDKVARLIGFELKGTHSLVLWAARRRDGVPPGAVPVSYFREETFTRSLFLFAMVVEAAGVEVLLRGLGVPHGLRVLVLVIDLYGIVIALAVHAACVTRPHVVTAGELRIRYGAFFDVRVPRELIASVRLVRNRNEEGFIRVADGTAAVVVSSQTNVIVELTEPVTVVRPLGRRAEVGTIRFFADSPEAVLAALRPSPEPALET